MHGLLHAGDQWPGRPLDILAGQNGNDVGQRLRSARVNRDDLGVRMGARSTAAWAVPGGSPRSSPKHPRPETRGASSTHSTERLSRRISMTLVLGSGRRPKGVPSRIDTMGPLFFNDWGLGDAAHVGDAGSNQNPTPYIQANPPPTSSNPQYGCKTSPNAAVPIY